MKEKEKLYEMDMEEAIFSGAEAYKKKEEELKRTSVIMPQIVRAAIENIQSRYDGLSQRYILYQIVKHGHSILQHNHEPEIRVIKKARIELGYPKMKCVRNFIYEVKTAINGLEKLRQREVQVHGWMMASIREMTEILGIEQSSLIRLSVYFSMKTAKELFPEMQIAANEEVCQFKQHLKERRIAYEGFVWMEKQWAEDCEEEKDLKKEGEKIDTEKEI